MCVSTLTGHSTHTAHTRHDTGSDMTTLGHMSHAPVRAQWGESGLWRGTLVVEHTLSIYHVVFFF